MDNIQKPWWSVGGIAALLGVSVLVAAWITDSLLWTAFAMAWFVIAAIQFWRRDQSS